MSPCRPVVPATVDEVVPLLQANDLPWVDLDPSTVEMLAVRSREGSVIGCVGIERFGRQVLVRSLAVDVNERGRGVARALLEAAIELAGSDGAAELIVAVTTTATEVLTRVGFSVIAREELHGPVTTSTELSGVCPEDATVVVLDVQSTGRAPAHRFGARQCAGSDRIDSRNAGTGPKPGFEESGREDCANPLTGA